jgi:hypothetical protein
MPSLDSSQIIAAGAPLHTRLIKHLALAFGICDSVVRDWRTGAKRNPIDQTKRYMKEVHEDTPGNVRLVVMHLAEYAEELDEAKGLALAASAERICIVLAREVEESANVITHLIVSASDGYDEDELREALVRISANLSALTMLEGCVRAELKKYQVLNTNPENKIDFPRGRGAVVADARAGKRGNLPAREF